MKMIKHKRIANLTAKKLNLFKRYAFLVIRNELCLHSSKLHDTPMR